MSKKQVILHIGIHKTGTSALQLWLDDHEEILAKTGFLYPKSLSYYPAHQELAWSMHDTLPSYADKEFKKDEVLDYYRNAIASSDPKSVVILSSEDLCHLNPFQIGELATFFNEMDVDVKIVCFIRKPIDYLVSTYHHRIIHFRERRKFREVTFEMPTLYLIDYPARLSAWANEFGASNTQVSLYDTTCFHGGDIVSNFFSVIGHPLEGYTPQSRKLNVGLHPMLSEACLAINSQIDDAKQREDLFEILQTVGMKLPPVSAEVVYLTEDERAALENISDEIKARMIDRYNCGW